MVFVASERPNYSVSSFLHLQAAWLHAQCHVRT